MVSVSQGEANEAGWKGIAPFSFVLGGSSPQKLQLLLLLRQFGSSIMAYLLEQAEETALW